MNVVMILCLQMLSEVVQRGLAIIANCTYASLGLRSKVRNQCTSTLLLYSDPNQNEKNKVIDVITIMNQIGCLDKLADHQWPDSLFAALSDFIRHTKYDDEFKGYYAPYNQEGGAVLKSFSNIMHCLDVLAGCRGYTCKVCNTLHPHGTKVEEILQKGSEINKNWTIKLLTTLQSHTCTHCVGGEWAGQLLQKYQS